MKRMEPQASIRADLYRYAGQYSLKAYVYHALFNPGFRFTLWYRRLRACGRNPLLRLYYRVRLYRLTVKYGYEIPAAARIGQGFFIGHLGGIAINPDAAIGDNVNISKGVTIGQENRGDRRGCPTIGSDVWIGANAVIVGKITVGSNVLIAPNAFVNFDVPNDSLVIGNPARIIHKPDATLGYINNRVGGNL